MTFSYERSTDNRRLSRLGERLLEHHIGHSSDWDKNEDDEEDGDGHRHSAKTKFTMYARCKVLDYGLNFELLQYVCDLTLWSSLGSKKKLCCASPMRLMLPGNWFGVIDLCRQVGLPRFMWACAPHERSSPYHAWVLGAMRKTLRPRLWLPIHERMTHMMV